MAKSSATTIEKAEVETIETAAKIEIGTLAAVVAPSATKMGVVKYLRLYPQNSYVEAIMKRKYPTDKKTKTEWDDVVSEILGTKIS